MAGRKNIVQLVQCTVRHALHTGGSCTTSYMAGLHALGTPWGMQSESQFFIPLHLIHRWAQEAKLPLARESAQMSR